MDTLNRSTDHFRIYGEIYFEFSSWYLLPAVCFKRYAHYAGCWQVFDHWIQEMIDKVGKGRVVPDYHYRIQFVRKVKKLVE